MSVAGGNSGKSKGNQNSILDQLEAVLPRAGVIFSESDELSHILCKPKILPLKSITLQKIEEMERAAFEKVKQTQDDGR